MTKIAKALAFLHATDCTPYAAAKHARIPPTTLYARLKLDKAKLLGVCPTCGAFRPAP